MTSRAEKLGLMVCRHCRLVCRRVGFAGRCPRCRAPIHPRHPNSLSRVWALLLAAVLCYLPANLLPVMHTTSLFGDEDDTILSGIVYFWQSGSPGLAILVFCASILIPLLKIFSLAILAWSVQTSWRHSAQHRALLFRIVEFVGRWSMLDIFVIALMVGLVRFRHFAVIEAGPGAAAFGAVVVLTMLSARSFDPRLLWDQARRYDDRQ